MEPLSFIVFPIVIFLTFFAAIWLFVCYILAWVGGWEKLARAYRYDGTFSGRRWRFRSCKMNGYANYNNCLTFGANPSGKILPELLVGPRREIDRSHSPFAEPADHLVRSDP